MIFYGHSRDFRHTCLCFYSACGNIRHTKYGNNSYTIDFHTVLEFVLYIIVNFNTQCGEKYGYSKLRNINTHYNNINTHQKKLKYCVAIFIKLYGNYYPPHEELKLMCIGNFARWTWVNWVSQQYGKNRKRCQQNTFYYAVWKLLLYFYREFPSKILSVYTNILCPISDITAIFSSERIAKGIFETIFIDKFEIRVK